MLDVRLLDPRQSLDSHGRATAGTSSFVADLRSAVIDDGADPASINGPDGVYLLPHSHPGVGRTLFDFGAPSFG